MNLIDVLREGNLLKGNPQKLKQNYDWWYPRITNFQWCQNKSIFCFVFHFVKIYQHDYFDTILWVVDKGHYLNQIPFARKYKQ